MSTIRSLAGAFAEAVPSDAALMRVFHTHSTTRAELRAVFASRLDNASRDAEATVRAILDDVQARGDQAVLDYTCRFDYPAARTLRVPASVLADAAESLSQTPLWNVLTQAAARITAFHEKQRRTSWMDTSKPGEVLGQIVRPLKRVGVYVPGGTAAYPSTVLMACLPARVAGVGEIVVTTPPNRDTGLPPLATLAACHLAGVTEVYAVGGAQAIGALAFGTDTIAPVDKIVGPGNIYVNLAKRLVFGTVGIDMLAGPSEVAVLADETARADLAAADILTQCEHDANSSALVATPSEEFADRLTREIKRQMTTLPRADLVRHALSHNGYLIVTSSLEEAAQVVSDYAPEHLHLVVREPWSLLGTIANAGAILVGEATSAPIGDYLAGPSHTLPTAGCARFASPLNVDDFTKKTSLLQFSDEAAKPLAELSAAFADWEGLEGHARAARRNFPG